MVHGITDMSQRIRLPDFGPEIVSGLDLWNRNSEQVADRSSRDKKGQGPNKIACDSGAGLRAGRSPAGHQLVMVRVEEVRVA